MEERPSQPAWLGQFRRLQAVFDSFPTAWQKHVHFYVQAYKESLRSANVPSGQTRECAWLFQAAVLEQLAAAMEKIGLPPTDERVRRVMNQFDASGDRQLQRAEFAALLRETWGSAVTVDVRDDLHLLYHDEGAVYRRVMSASAAAPGTSATAPRFGEYVPRGKATALAPARRGLTWLGRNAPTHFVLRALRHAWPEPVESVALLRNTQQNDALDPSLMLS